MMHKVKDAYYCNICEKDVDVEVSSTIRAVYTSMKVEVVIHVYCAECKMPLDTAVELISVRD